MYKKLLLWVTATILLLVMVISGALLYMHYRQPLISDTITKQLTSSLYLVRGSAVALDKKSIKYDNELKQLSYTTTFNNVKIIISEQPSPEVFSDVPQYFPKWISSTGAIANFDTPNGKVYLASNPNYGVNTVAIMNSKGTLLFAKPDKNLTEDQWKQFFRNVTLVN